ncbi:hypothetical protein ACN08Y_03725 [Rothia sp. P5764]|uniref:hypothetical protein n=1 Tax=Rothia sp. P5764 TaxID=3402654 RepID=UPI003AC7DECD
MTTQNPAPNLPPQPGAVGNLPPQVPLVPAFDIVTPGEPQEFLVPPQFRKPYGALVRDKRGKGYYLAVMSFSAAVTSYLVVFLAGILALAALIPAVGAIVLGIQALRSKSRSPQTQLAGQTSGFAWGGIALGALCLPLTVGMFLLNSWFLSSAEAANCEYLYRGDEAAIQRCIEANTY